MILAMRQFWNDYKRLILILLSIVLIPVGLNIIFIYGDFTTGKDLGNVAWLAFWGSYLGGAATLIAVYLTLRQNMRVINQQEERTRIALMPYIEVMLFPDENFTLHKTKLYPPNGFIILTNDPNEKNNEKNIRFDLPRKYQQLIEWPWIRKIDGNGFDVDFPRRATSNFVRLIMTQKAPSLARNIQLSVCLVVEEEEEIRTYINPAFVLASTDSVKIPIFFDEDWPEGEYKFIVSFEDIEGRGYEQFFTIHHKGVASEKCGFTTLRICMILCNVVTNAAITKISVNVAGTGFPETRIKSRINNVPMEKAQTLILTGFVPFWYVPKLAFGNVI